MAVISHCGVDYTAPTVEVQSDASATSLEATKVPTGQTITSYLNSNYAKITNDTGLLAGNKTYNSNATADITTNNWKTYRELILRVTYGSANLAITVPVAFLKSQTSVRFPAVFNAATNGSYIQINSTTDSTLNITNGVAYQVNIAVYGLK